MQTQGSNHSGHQEALVGDKVEAWADREENNDMAKKKYELSAKDDKKKEEALPATTCEKASLEGDPKEHKKWWHVCLKIMFCFLGGILFGIALEKTRVFEPNVIRDQFVYQRFIMMKAFLAAMATGLLCLGVMALLPVTRPVFQDIRHVFINHQEKGVLTSVVGGLLLGMGMTISGACPGMVLAQVGAGVGMGSALLTLLGCLVGVAMYAAVEPWVVKYTKPTGPYKKKHVDDWVPLPYAALSFAFTFAIALLIFGLEYVKPWQTELCEYTHLNTSSVSCVPVPNNGDWTCFMSLRAWPPWIGGIVIGLLQLVITLSVGDTLGGSSSYCTVMSQVLSYAWIVIGLLQLVITLSVGDTLGGSSSYCTVVSQVLVTDRLQQMSPYLSRYRTGLGNWWQVVYVVGAVVGALISAASSQTLGTVKGVSMASGFFGGLIMLFGARLGAGCTSGHGLSGTALLVIISFFAVAAMFAGGTIIGFIMWGAARADMANFPLNYVSY
ncbi:thiosulfate transporter TsuA-like [Branchiostoma lanceolatum]|uniref:thiosulfate transporter TsuA-like n=1 Tax=Branchiostoma lanceolatum TaxID=7740 RepID=UPI003454AA1E